MKTSTNPPSRWASDFWPSWFNENFSYKLVALFVTMVLWVAVKGERDIANKTVQIEFQLAQDHVIANSPTRSIRVEVIGPRIVLKKFLQSKRPLTLDLTGLSPGHHQISLSSEKIDLPRDLRVLSFEPNSVTVHLRRFEREPPEDIGVDHGTTSSPANGNSAKESQEEPKSQ